MDSVLLNKMTNFLLCLMALAVHSQEEDTLISPCPNVFTYETPEPNYDTWYGVLSLSTDGILNSLLLNIVLDSKAVLLGNWVADVSTQDYINFKIVISEMMIEPGPTVAVRFFVQFNPVNKPPKLQAISLNGREICNANISLPAVDIPKLDRPQNPQCGTVSKNPVTLVLNGSPTQEGQWPWQVALYRTENVNNNYICGGTLVAPMHIITTAHCATDRNYYPGRRIHTGPLTVYLGRHNLVTSTRGVQIRFVKKVKVHPEYDPKLLSRDLSILVLHEPVQYTEWVQPACLWPEHLVDVTNIVGKSGSVVGWGNDGSGELLLVMMPVVDEITCIRSKSDFFVTFTSNYTFCAGFRNGTSACNGDSGGGMVFNLDGSWYLRGVVSVAPAKNNEPICDPSHYVVFTDVAQFLPWIKDNIKD